MSDAAPSACIVGAGAAGLALAHSLAAVGWRVTMVEGGSDRPPPVLEDTYRVMQTGIPHRGVHEGRFRGWGGSTTRWGGQLWAWEPHEFEARPSIGVEGWPIAYGDVVPFYDAALKLLGVAGAPITPEEASHRGVHLPPFDPTAFAIKYSTWLPWQLRNLGGSIGRALRRRPNVEVLDRSTVTGIVLEDGGGRARGVTVRDAAGASSIVEADYIIIAAGAVESSRLLLASLAPPPPGGDGGWLGRGFMDHLSVRVGRFVPSDLRHFAQTFAPLWRRGIQHTPRMLVRPPVLARERLLSAYGHWEIAPAAGSALFLVREALRRVQSGQGPGLHMGDARRMLRGATDIAALCWGLAVDGRRWFPRDAGIHLRVDTEQLPDPESRLTLTNQRDEHGLPRVTLEWRVSDLERHTVRRVATLLAAELKRLGLGTLHPIEDPFDPSRSWGALRGDSFHMMGGTRMARDASRGVVDTDGRVFGCANLYVAGSSVFPTGGMANPTLTLIALSLRLGAHLRGLHLPAIQ